MSKTDLEGGALAEKQLLELENMLQNKANTKMTRVTEGISAFWRPSNAGPLKKSPPPTVALRPTAYLDGLRGWAALLVYSLHHQVWGHSGVGGEFILENAFGWDKKYYFVCFPGIRILFSGGHFAVAVFFIISGYALSVKPLSLIQAKETAKLGQNLASALFRRWIRLFLPVLGMTFVWMTCWHVFGVKSSNPIAPPKEKNWFDEVWMWYCDFKNFSFIFNGDIFNKYNDHAWSIPMEFRGSIVVYTTLLALSESATYTRIKIQAALIFYFIYIVDGWFCALFVMGMLIGDITMLANKKQLPAPLERVAHRFSSQWVAYAFLFAALYLGGVPSITEDLPHLRRSPGWYFLSFLKPQAAYDFRFFYRFWAATFAMIAIPRIPWVKALFETPLSQYFGKISFAFYLVHGPVLWTVGDRIYAATGRLREGHIAICPRWMNLFPFPNWGPFGLELNYLAAHLILFPLTLGLAEIAMKLFDEPSLKLAQWAFKMSKDGSSKDDRKSANGRLE